MSEFFTTEHNPSGNFHRAQRTSNQGISVKEEVPLTPRFYPGSLYQLLSPITEQGVLRHMPHDIITATCFEKFTTSDLEADATQAAGTCSCFDRTNLLGKKLDLLLVARMVLLSQHCFQRNSERSFLRIIRWANEELVVKNYQSPEQISLRRIVLYDQQKRKKTAFGTQALSIPIQHHTP